MSYRRGVLLADLQELRAKLGVMVQRLVAAKEDEAASYLDSSTEYVDHAVKAVKDPKPEPKKKKMKR